MINRKTSVIALSVISTLAVANPVQHIEPQNQQEQPTFDEFYEDSERGWYWYEQQPKENEEQTPPPSNQPKVIPKSDSQVVQTERPLSQKWFRENFEKYRDAAIENPHDQEAMKTYLYLERYMTDRAMTFGYERQKAIYGDPFLDGTTRRSTANFGMRSMNIDAANKRKDSLKNLAEQAGIVFFFRSDDGYSTQQAPLVNNISRHYGFTVKPVSIDGKNLPNSPWSDDLVAVDSGQAQHLGVLKLPALYLFVSSTNQFELIAQGLQSQTQIEHRIMYAAHRGQLITNEEFNSVKATGLYQDINGNTGVVGVPDNAPKAFLDLYQQSIGQPTANQGK